MIERRRPLENDDGQESLFDSAGLSPSRPRAPWEERDPADEAQVASPPEARVGAADALPADADLRVTDAPPEARVGAVDAPLADADPRVTDAPPAEALAGDEPAPAPARAELVGDAPNLDAASGAEMLAGPEAPRTDVPAPDEVFAGDELEALEGLEVSVDDLRAPRTPRAPLVGPTLDDVVSRAWEGLATGLPAACPLCHGEVVPSAHGRLSGRCTSCGTTIE